MLPIHAAPTCSVAGAAEIVGSKWTVLIVHDLSEGPRRFTELECSCAGISPRTLAERLRWLETEDIVARQSYPESPPRVEYALTEKGLDLYPVLVSLMQWGTRHGGGDTPIVLQHKGCGATVEPHLACPECGEAVGARDMRALPGPDAVLRQTA